MSALLRFFARRWQHQLPVNRLLLWEVLAWGSVLNLLATFAGLMAVALGAGGAWGLALHFAPTPANLFWATCVWRHAQARAWHRAGALAWLGAMLLV